MAGNTIHLPIFDPNVTKYTNNDHTLFYAPSGRVYLPPNIFYCFGINGILTKLTNKKKDAISHQGDLWATKYWNLYAFIDPTQRDDDARPVQILDPTPLLINSNSSKGCWNYLVRRRVLYFWDRLRRTSIERL